MAPTTFVQAEIDHELVELVKRSPSLNAMPKVDREKVILRIFTFPLNKQLEIKDMLLQEQEDMAKATPQDMHARYMQLKEVYAKLKAEKSKLEGKLRSVREAKFKKTEEKEIEKLEIALDDEDENDEENPALPSYP